MTTDIDFMLKSKAWPFIEAKRIYETVKKSQDKKEYILFETGYGPSGLPHIGTFSEVMRTTMVMQAFHKICDIPTRLICFSDDMDGLRKVPDNIPNKELITQHLGKPLTSVPDPFEEKSSYGEYMNQKLRGFLDRFGFNYEFASATEYYGSGKFNDMIIKVMEKYQKIMDVMLPTLGDERRATYSPILPICPKTGIVLQVPLEKIDPKNAEISYKDAEGELVTMSPLNGNSKLQWKPDFAMRWAALKVDYEMYGKDHQANASIYNKICTILDGKPPIQFFFEMFLAENGEKISKSKGNAITIDEWLRYAPQETMELFIFQTPAKAKRLYFDVIPKTVDEYVKFNEAYHKEEENAKKLSNPLYHIHNGDVPKINNFGISFSLILNLASVCNPDHKSVLWGFIKKYIASDTNNDAIDLDENDDKMKYLDHMIGFAINYYNDFVKNTKSYLTASVAHKKILSDLVNKLSTLNSEEVTADDIQNMLYELARNSEYENMREFFGDLYKILLGQESGPRLGSFFKLYGVDNTLNLIKSKL